MAIFAICEHGSDLLPRDGREVAGRRGVGLLVDPPAAFSRDPDGVAVSFTGVKRVDAIKSWLRFPWDVIKSGCLSLWAIIRPSKIDDLPRIKAARAFKEGVEVEPDVEYRWTYDYAREAYNRLMEARDALDDKAGDIIKYLGGGAGLFTLAAMLNVRPENRYVPLWAIPSFLSTILSLFFAILARQPSEVAIPPTIEGAKEYADAYKQEDAAMARFLGQWHLAYEMLRATNETMGKRVQASIWFFFAAIVLLVLPLGATLL